MHTFYNIQKTHQTVHSVHILGISKTLPLSQHIGHLIFVIGIGTIKILVLTCNKDLVLIS